MSEGTENAEAQKPSKSKGFGQKVWRVRPQEGSPRSAVQQALIEIKQDAKSPGNSTFPGFFHARKSLIGFHGLSRILTGVL
jgi:hypothetical protein